MISSPVGHSSLSLPSPSRDTVATQSRRLKPKVKMGGGPDKDELLITLPLPSVVFPLDDVKSRFPDINVTYVQVTGDEAKKEPKKSELKGMGKTRIWNVTNRHIALYQKTTLLVTVQNLPESADDVPKYVQFESESRAIDRV
jgi:hypothetical protein